jgi:DNA-binding transcriptional LysR family regulator
MPHHKTSPALDWEDVRFFAALARHRGVTATARALQATPEAVERRLANLESTLGHRLFQRTGHTLELNAAGAAALAEAAQMEMAACSLGQLRAREELSVGDRADCTGRCDPRRR